MSRHFLRSLLYTTLLSTFYGNNLTAVPQNNILDSAPMHSLRGSDNFYKEVNKPTLSLSLAPFYLHTATTSQPGTGKTWGSNIYGQWNMAALFFNTPSTINTTLLPNYTAAKTAIAGFPTSTATSPYNIDLTNPATYSPDNPSMQVVRYDYIPVNVEKSGIRSKIGIDLGGGFGLSVKGGVSLLKQAAGNFSTAQLTTDMNPPTSSDNSTNATTLFNYLMGDEGRTLVAKDLGMDLRSFKKTSLEDMHVATHWHLPIPMKEKDTLVFNLVPFFSIGAWLPLAERRDQNKVFSLPGGSDGHLGLTAETAIAFDFPDMLQISIGGGAAFYAAKDFASYRVPTSKYQTSIIPWRTAVTKEPGVTWYLNASMKAENFVSKKDIPNFSFYFDYIYTEHMHDSIILREPNPVLASFFRPDILEERSSYKTIEMFGALHCAITSNIGFGIGAQGTISGTRSYRPTTLIWSLDIAL